MRILGFSVMWNKLESLEFTTFRLPRKDIDWHIGERVQVVYHPRSKDRKPLFLADIINVEPRSFDPAIAPVITYNEALADGFPNGTIGMRAWFEKSHGHFNASTIFNKLTLRRVYRPPLEAQGVNK